MATKDMLIKQGVINEKLQRQGYAQVTCRSPDPLGPEPSCLGCDAADRIAALVLSGSTNWTVHAHGCEKACRRPIRLLEYVAYGW